MKSLLERVQWRDDRKLKEERWGTTCIKRTEQGMLQIMVSDRSPMATGEHIIVNLA